MNFFDRDNLKRIGINKLKYSLIFVFIVKNIAKTKTQKKIKILFCALNNTRKGLSY